MSIRTSAEVETDTLPTPDQIDSDEETLRLDRKTLEARELRVRTALRAGIAGTPSAEGSGGGDPHPT